MYSFKTEIINFNEASLYSAIGALSVYVIWDAKSTIIPAYIGEGNLLARLHDHNKNFHPPLNGYIATFGWEEEKNKDQ